MATSLWSRPLSPTGEQLLSELHAGPQGAATAKNTNVDSGYEYFGRNSKYSWNFNLNQAADHPLSKSESVRARFFYWITAPDLRFISK